MPLNGSFIILHSLNIRLLWNPFEFSVWALCEHLLSPFSPFISFCALKTSIKLGWYDSWLQGIQSYKSPANLKKQLYVWERSLNNAQYGRWHRVTLMETLNTVTMVSVKNTPKRGWCCWLPLLIPENLISSASQLIMNTWEMPVIVLLSIRIKYNKSLICFLFLHFCPV